MPTDYTADPTKVTGLSMNWTGLSFSYGATPTVINFLEVNGVDTDESGDLKQYSGNNASFVTHQRMTNQKRKITLDVADTANALAVPYNTPGTLAGTLNDFYNAAAIGSETFTAVNAQLVSRKQNGKHNDIAGWTLEFECASVDGATDPLTWAAGS